MPNEQDGRKLAEDSETVGTGVGTSPEKHSLTYEDGEDSSDMFSPSWFPRTTADLIKYCILGGTGLRGPGRNQETR